MRLEFVVPGQPMGLARHRTRVIHPKKGGKAFATQYDPPENESKKAEIAYHARQAWNLQDKSLVESFAGALRLVVISYFMRPKSCKGRPFPTVKPDFDNLAKMVCDALNKVMFRDDCQICDAHIYKRYAAENEMPSTKVIIEDMTVKDMEIFFNHDFDNLF